MTGFVNVTDTRQAAEQRAREIGKKLKTLEPLEEGYWARDIKEVPVIIDLVRSYSEGPREVFLYELGQSLGGLRVFQMHKTMEFLGDEYYWSQTIKADREMKQVNWSTTYIKNKKTSISLLDAYLVIPITKTKVSHGYTETHRFAIYDESSHTKGGEKYVDVSVGVQLEAKLAEKGSVTVKAGGGVKGGYKKFQKDETKHSTRIVDQMSVSYAVKVLLHNVILLSPGEIGIWSVHKEYGYLVEPKEGGDTRGPFWPIWSKDVQGIPWAFPDSADWPLNKLLSSFKVRDAELLVRRARSKGLL